MSTIEREPRVRAIEGCQHPVDRMIQWADAGACPICLTAALKWMRSDRDRLLHALRASVELLEKTSQPEAAARARQIVEAKR